MSGNGAGASGNGPNGYPTCVWPARWNAATLLSRLPAASAEALLRLGTEVRVRTGTPILHEGESSDHVYLLVSGCVKVTGNDNGVEPLLGIRIAGDVIGEMAALTRSPRSATVTTCSDTCTRVIPGARFTMLLERHPSVAIALAAMISDRLRWANQWRVSFAALDAPSRVVRVLVALTETYGQQTLEGRDLGAPLTQREIAALAGVRLASAEKALRRLQRDKVLKLAYRSVVVTDLAGLRAIADE